MRCSRCGGLMALEKFEVFGLGSCGEIVDLVIAAHRRLTSPAAASLQALTTVQESSFPHRRIEQRITSRS
jgi:hypothetical protein